MITRGIIRAVPSGEETYIDGKLQVDNLFQVEIPTLRTANNTTTTSTSIFLSDALLCYQPGNLNSYRVGDVVFLTIDEPESLPIIIGKMYVGDEDATNYSKNNTLEVTQKAILPEDTKIGDISFRELKCTIKTASNGDGVYATQDEVDAITEDIGGINEDLGEINEDIGTINEDIGTINEDIGTINEDLGTINERLDELGFDSASASRTWVSGFNESYPLPILWETKPQICYSISGGIEKEGNFARIHLNFEVLEGGEVTTGSISCGYKVTIPSKFRPSSTQNITTMSPGRQVITYTIGTDGTLDYQLYNPNLYESKIIAGVRINIDCVYRLN